MAETALLFLVLVSRFWLLLPGIAHQSLRMNPLNPKSVRSTSVNVCGLTVDFSPFTAL